MRTIQSRFYECSLNLSYIVMTRTSLQLHLDSSHSKLLMTFDMIETLSWCLLAMDSYVPAATIALFMIYLRPYVLETSSYNINLGHPQIGKLQPLKFISSVLNIFMKLTKIQIFLWSTVVKTGIGKEQMLQINTLLVQRQINCVFKLSRNGASTVHSHLAEHTLRLLFSLTWTRFLWTHM